MGVAKSAFLFVFFSMKIEPLSLTAVELSFAVQYISGNFAASKNYFLVAGSRIPFLVSKELLLDCTL